MAVQVHQVEANMSSLTTMLAEGELDIAFVRLPCESSKVFELKILDREPMVVALHRDHPWRRVAIWRWRSCGIRRWCCFPGGRAGAV